MNIRADVGLSDFLADFLNGKLVKMWVYHLQSDGNRLDPVKEHYAMIAYDLDASSNSELLEAGIYVSYDAADDSAFNALGIDSWNNGFDDIDANKRLAFEILGADDYTIAAWANLEVDGDYIHGTATGLMWNPYSQSENLSVMEFRNIKLNTEIDGDILYQPSLLE